MAPGTRRKLLSPPVSAPQSHSSSPRTSNSPRIHNGHGKKKRGKTRGIGLERLIHATKSKLQVDFTIEDGKPTGPNASKLANEIGIVVRNHASLTVEKWKDICDETKQPMVDRIMGKFDIDISQPHVVRYFENAMSTRYKQFRHKLKEKFEKYSKLDDAKHNKPEEVASQEDWNFLCDRFDSEKFKERSTQNAQNRDKLAFVHRGGSKSFIQHQKDMVVKINKTV